MNIRFDDRIDDLLIVVFQLKERIKNVGSLRVDIEEMREFSRGGHAVSILCATSEETKDALRQTGIYPQ